MIQDISLLFGISRFANHHELPTCLPMFGFIASNLIKLAVETSRYTRLCLTGLLYSARAMVLFNVLVLFDRLDPSHSLLMIRDLQARYCISEVHMLLLVRITG